MQKKSLNVPNKGNKLMKYDSMCHIPKSITLNSNQIKIQLHFK